MAQPVDFQQWSNAQIDAEIVAQDKKRNAMIDYEIRLGDIDREIVAAERQIVFLRKEAVELRQRLEAMKR